MIVIHRWALLPLRIGFGLFLVLASMGNMSAGWLTHPTNLSKILDFSLSTTYRFYWPVAHFLSLHARAVAIALCLGEILAGVALILGLFPRIVSVLCLCIALQFLFLQGHLWSTPTEYILTFIILVTLSFCPTGHAFGLGQRWSGKWWSA